MQKKDGRDQFSNETLTGVARDVLESRKGKGLIKKGETLFTYKHESFPILLGSMFVLLWVCVFVNKCIMKAPSTLRPLFLALRAQTQKNDADGNANGNDKIDDGITNEGYVNDASFNRKKKQIF